MPEVAALQRVIRSAEPVQPAPAWQTWLSFALALGGLGVSTYLTVVHFVGTQILACTSNHTFNCEAVITSPQSYVVGIPVAVLGLAYYVVMVGLCSPFAWRARDRRIQLARLAMVVLGIGFVLYLVSAELLVIKSICIWCTVVHVLTFAQLLLVVATVPTMIGWGQELEPAASPARRSAPSSRRSSAKTTPASRTRGNGKEPRPVSAQARARRR